MVKKIHYCWFGGKKLPKDVKKCIKTWKKYLPDYEIKEWNESNFDINICNFVKQAYDNKKWAFVSDYARIYALYNEGGIYFDTDMKVLKDVSNIVDKEVFFGYEDSGYLGTAMIGVKDKHNKFIKEILDYYNNIKSFNPEIIYSYANPVIITKLINKYTYEKNEKGIKIFDNSIYVYPRDYFYPLSYNYAEREYTENTCMVHLFNATWTDRAERRTISIYRKFGPNIGKAINNKINSIFYFKDKMINSMKNFYNFIRMQYSIHINRNRRVKRIKSEIEKIKGERIVIYHPENNMGKEILQDNMQEYMLGIREQYTQKEANMIAKELTDSGKKIIIFTEMVPGWDKLFYAIKRINPLVKIKLLYTEGNLILATPSKWEPYSNMLDLYSKGKIDEFIFMNKNLYEFYRKKGYNTSLFLNNVKIADKERYLNKDNSEVLKIGLYEAEDIFSKNIYNQLSAISLLNNYELDCAPVNYKILHLVRKFNINLTNAAPINDKTELYDRLSKNDINLDIIYSELPPILSLESFELGKICICGKNNYYFNDSELGKYIIVEDEDNIIEIFNKIKFAYQNKEKILNLYKDWKKEYDIKSEKSIKTLLEL